MYQPWITIVKKDKGKQKKGKQNYSFKWWDQISKDESLFSYGKAILRQSI